MFQIQFPSYDQARKNFRKLVETWQGHSNRTITKEELKTQIQMCRQLWVYHLCFDPEKLLRDGYIRPFSDLAPRKHSMQWEIDKLVGLDQYVFLSFGAPVVAPASEELIVCYSRRHLQREFRYPISWFSWGDLYQAEIREALDSYSRAIFPVSWLPLVAGWFSALFYSDPLHAAAEKWRIPNTRGFFFRGPEIKVMNPIPLKHACAFLIEEELELSSSLNKLLRKFDVPLIRIPPGNAPRYWDSIRRLTALRDTKTA
ncbi:MAG: hypothetical protein ACPLRW_07550 [Moorellales bacterium]